MNPVVSSSHQMSIDFEPGLAERHQSALDCVRECAYTHKHPLKTLAADMDMSQSELSRKLAHNPDDPRRFTLDDLEKFLTATGDMTPIYYLVEKYLEDSDLRQRRALAELVKLAPQLAALIKQATPQ
ncbi:MAG: phage regulatory CII family protein [Candidatus Accumulibacter sp.]|uniref:phage regulatory CII family protein n=1 Tax=Accumulibacter sp. TaxID=2053492 RepID=UPI0025840F6B|nr:phage regulatory CII family protein [Accumulibacter sp.]MBK8113627.1 phage regulatory CII family protein [Accumulibacter sp.]